MGIKTLAHDFSRAFETRERNNGEKFVCLADDSPEWISELVRDLHDGRMPNDSDYAAIERAADAVAEAESDDAEDIRVYLSDSPFESIWTSDTLGWIAASSENRARADEMLDEGIAHDIETAGIWAMSRQRDELAESIISALELLDEDEDEDEEEEDD